MHNFTIIFTNLENIGTKIFHKHKFLIKNTSMTSQIKFTENLNSFVQQNIFIS